MLVVKPHAATETYLSRCKDLNTHLYRYDCKLLEPCTPHSLYAVLRRHRDSPEFITTIEGAAEPLRCLACRK